MSPSEAAGEFPTASYTATAADLSCRNSGGQCSCLAKLVMTLKKCRKMVGSKGRGRNSRQASFQCRYDPLSYALNFDSGGCGGSYEDYYRFCAFTNRFLTRPTATAASTTPVLAISR